MATAATGSPSVRVLTSAEQSYLAFGTTSSYLIEERQRLRTIRDNLPVIDPSMMAELRTANQLARSLIADLRARQPAFGLPSDLDVRATQTLAFMQYDAGVNAEYIRIYGQQVAQRETAGSSLSGRTAMVSGSAAAAMNAPPVRPPVQPLVQPSLQNSRDTLIAAATQLNYEHEAGLKELRRRGAFLEEDLPIQAQLHTETQNQLRQQYRAIEEEMHALNAEDERPNALLRAAAERGSTVPGLLLQSREQAVTAALAQARADSDAPAPAAGARPEAPLGTNRHHPRRAELQRVFQQIEQELQLDVQCYENHIAQIHQKLDDVRSEWHERTRDYDRIRSSHEQQFSQLNAPADSIA